MAKLKCTKHGRRVFIWRGKNDTGMVSHRSGDFLCTTDTVYIGKKANKMAPEAIINQTGKSKGE